MCSGRPRPPSGPHEPPGSRPFDRAYLPIPVDEAIADEYGRALALARDDGQPAKATDLLIIATAAATGRALVTRDERQASLARRAGLAVVVPA